MATTKSLLYAIYVYLNLKKQLVEPDLIRQQTGVWKI